MEREGIGGGSWGSEDKHSAFCATLCVRQPSTDPPHLSIGLEYFEGPATSCTTWFRSRYESETAPRTTWERGTRRRVWESSMRVNSVSSR
jgi:hypothetical protein